MRRTETFIALQHGAGMLAGFASAAILLAGCAAAPPKTPEKAVAERAQARWEALLAKDYDSAYTYYSPGYRSAMSLAGFRQRRATQRVRWTQAEFKGVECEQQVCHSRFQVTYKYRMPVRGVGEVQSSRLVTENWVLADGGWYYVPPQGGGLR